MFCRSNLLVFSFVKNRCNVLSNSKRFAGHSKWANIKHTKAAKDNQKAILFGRLAYMIRFAINEGGSADPKLNTKLSNIIEIARKQSMPNGTINDILKSATLENCTESVIELHGPSGSVILVTVLTNSVNRVKTDFNSILNKFNRIVKHAQISRANQIFDHKGVIDVKSENVTLEEATNHAIEVDAEDVIEVENEANRLEFYCHPSQLNKVTSKLKELGYEILSSSAEYIPQPEACVSIKESDTETVRNLKSKLEAYPAVVSLCDNIIW